MAKMRKVTTVRGYGHFVGTNHVEVEETTGTGPGEDRHQEGGGLQARHHRRRQPGRAPALHARRPARGGFHRRAGAEGCPKRMLILGGGIIGLEMGTVYSTLGARLDVVEMMDGLMQGADRDLVKIWQKMNAKRFDNIMLKTKTVGAKATPEGIEVTFASGGGRHRPRAAGTTWCCRPWAARPTARRSPPTRPAWP
jgi:dihydrolipoamide dehydrogenase